MIKKATLYSLSQSRELLQIHQTACPECLKHKPCPKSKYRGITVLDTNELQFYIRVMAPARTSNNSIQFNSLFTIVNQFIDDFYSPEDFLAYSTPDNSYQLLFTLSDNNSNDVYSQLQSPTSYHCFSTPIIIESVIHPDTMGIFAGIYFISFEGLNFFLFSFFFFSIKESILEKDSRTC